MASIRGKDTKPEMIVRKMVRGLGYQYRLHRKDLPGKPDLVFSGMKKVIFVHGCFWHKHRCRYGKVVPQTNAEFWDAKRESNRLRDRKNKNDIRAMGWESLTIWECWTKAADKRRKLERNIRIYMTK